MSQSRWNKASLKEKPRRVIPLEDLIVKSYNTKARKQRKKALPKLLMRYRKKQLLARRKRKTS